MHEADMDRLHPDQNILAFIHSDDLVNTTRDVAPTISVSNTSLLVTQAQQ